MSLGGWLVVVVAALYLVASAAYAMQRNFGLALVFFAYALANVGLIIVGEK